MIMKSWGHVVYSSQYSGNPLFIVIMESIFS